MRKILDSKAAPVDLNNRTSASVNGRTGGYAVNNELNQYSERAVPAAFDVVGETDAGLPVKVNGTLAARQEGRFHREVAVSNGSAPVWSSVVVQAFKPGGGSPHDDYSRTLPASGQGSHVFVPRTPEVFSHDDDGNLTGDSRWSYVWDRENRLIRLETIAAAVTAGVPKRKIEHSYDGQSRRIETRVYGWVAGAYQLTARTRYAYDLGWNVLALLDGLSGNAVKETFLWGLDVSGSLGNAGGVGGLLTLKETAGGTVHGYAYDGNGNVMKLIQLSTGTVSAEYGYGPFGEPLRATGPMARGNPFRWSTKYCDDETGLSYYGYRFYDPHVGRWINRDPVGERGGLNVYAFVRNDPIDSIDLLGLDTIDVGHCEIVIAMGHQVASDPHKFKYKDADSGSAYVGCWPDKTNTDASHNLSGAPTHGELVYLPYELADILSTWKTNLNDQGVLIKFMDDLSTARGSVAKMVRKLCKNCRCTKIKIIEKKVGPSQSDIPEPQAPFEFTCTAKLSESE